MDSFNVKAYLFDTRALCIAAWNGHADPKPGSLIHKIVRRVRTGIMVSSSHMNLYGPPLLHCTHLAKALDALNPSRHGVEIDLQLAGTNAARCLEKNFDMDATKSCSGFQEHSGNRAIPAASH